MKPNENPVYGRENTDDQVADDQPNDQTRPVRYWGRDVILFIIVILASLLAGAAAANFWKIPPGHIITFAGAVVVVVAAVWKAGRLPKNYLAIAGALLAAIGGIVSGIQADLMQERLLVAIKGGDAVPYLTFHYREERSGLVKIHYDGKYPIFDVQFELHHLEKKLKLNREGKLPKAVQEATVYKIPLFPKNLIPGYSSEWPHFEFPEERIATYQIYVMTRNNIFIEYCRLVRLDTSEKFVCGCFVIDPSEDRKVLKMFHDPEFPKDPNGAFNWPKADFLVPPLPELETFKSN